ncbi:hypothetical protein MKW94_015064 [Papaver nudicaule]|uniref:MORF/ORRM1/DAG-like MORF domain-containing protein n=1 Tax=Papaver nudicaule TaxID=74823 RepID=A0AA41SAR3_PAPNU|nr:hypothetical protein [Papaver nudicaule]
MPAKDGKYFSKTNQKDISPNFILLTTAAMALCRRGGSLIIKSIPSYSSYRSSVSRSSYRLCCGVSAALLKPATIPPGSAASTLKRMSTIISPSDDPQHISKCLWDEEPDRDEESDSDEADWDEESDLYEESVSDYVIAGCDDEHWLVVMEEPQGKPSRDEIIDSYVNTLSKVLGSEEEARMKIYSVSTRFYFAFGALVSEELSNKIQDLPGVRWVLPDSYLDVKNKSYPGEPFIDGKAVPYDPKYHEECSRNNPRWGKREKFVKQEHDWLRSMDETTTEVSWRNGNSDSD